MYGTRCIKCGSYGWRRDEDGREACGLCGAYPFPDNNPFSRRREDGAIPARTVTISPEAEAATDAAIGKLWAKGMRPTPAQRARIESIIQSVIDEHEKGEQP